MHVLRFLNLHGYPTLGQASPELHRALLRRGLPVVWLFVDPDVEQVRSIRCMLACC